MNFFSVFNVKEHFVLIFVVSLETVGISSFLVRGGNNFLQYIVKGHEEILSALNCLTCGVGLRRTLQILLLYCTVGVDGISQ